MGRATKSMTCKNTIHPGPKSPNSAQCDSHGLLHKLQSDRQGRARSSNTYVKIQTDTSATLLVTVTIVHRKLFLTYHVACSGGTFDVAGGAPALQPHFDNGSGLNLYPSGFVNLLMIASRVTASSLSGRCADYATQQRSQATPGTTSANM